MAKKKISFKTRKGRTVTYDGHKTIISRVRKGDKLLSENSMYAPKFMMRCDICGKKSEFKSTWLFLLDGRLFGFRARDQHFPEKVAVCRECRYNQPIAKMYDAVYKRILNRSVGKYAKAKNKRAKQGRHGAGRKIVVDFEQAVQKERRKRTTLRDRLRGLFIP